MQFNDTKNSLTESEIHMCLALAESAINTRIKEVWRRWIKRNQKFKTNKDNIASLNIIADDKSGEINVKISPLSVSFSNNQNDNQKLQGQQVKVTLTLESVYFFDFMLLQKSAKLL